MNKLLSLLLLELRGLYGLNKFRHCRDPREKNRYRIVLAACMLLLVMALAYVGGLVYGLCSLGLGAIVPAYLTAIGSALVFALGIFVAGNRIFGLGGYDLLASLPLKPGALVLSRFLSLYVEDLVWTLVIWLPGLAVYGVCQRPGPSLFLQAVPVILLLPAIPLVLATLAGSLVLGLSARMRHKSLVQTGLLVLLVVGILVGSFSVGDAPEGLTPEAFAALAQTIGSLLGQIYPPALWVNGAMVAGELWGLALFALISLGMMAVVIGITARHFHHISTRLRGFSASRSYRLGAMESRHLGKALYLRELRRYFSSSIYVTNTIIGPILGTILAVALAVSGLEPIRQSLPLQIDIPGLLPYVFSAVFCMMNTTSVSISMEGRQFWGIQALPIPAKALLDSKLLLNLSLMLPFYLVSLVAMAVGIRADFVQLWWLAVIPASIMVFSVVLGITVNLRFHSFDWEKEEAVVKQSLSSALGGFAGFLVSAALAVLVLAVPAAFTDGVKLGGCLVLWLLTAVLYRKNNRISLAEL